MSLWKTLLLVTTALWGCSIPLVHGLSSSTGTKRVAVPSSSPAAAAVSVIPPGGRFKTSSSDSFSVVSYNALASYYHSLQFLRSHQPDSQQIAEEAMKRDEQTRVPRSINVAKATNADILCLQEVQDPDALKKQLAMSSEKTEGYDCVHWMPLHPKRQHMDPVGLAVAYRSSKFTVVSDDAIQPIRRGMVATLQMRVNGDDDNDSEERFLAITIANVHLPARPAAVDGRLYGTIKAVQAVQQAQRRYQQEPKSNHHKTKFIGIICGDMNSDVDAPHLRYYLSQGRIAAGKYKDRNYVLRVSKPTAATLLRSRHAGFTHAYDSVFSPISQKNVANVTVSLHGRGPGRMDHVYFTNALPPSADNDKPSMSSLLGRRRSTRRQRSNHRRNTGMAVPHTSCLPHPTRNSTEYGVQAVLATMDQNVTRTQIIQHDGLPNEANGFFSDHLPIGVLLGPITDHHEEALTTASQSPQLVPPPPPLAPTTGRASPLSTAAQQRRFLYQASATRRRRHNSVLRTLVQHLNAVQPPPALLLSDVPLYKWPWKLKVRQKTRAPDLCAVVGGTAAGGDSGDNQQQCCHVIVVEVTVVDTARQLEEAYQRKADKYRDVVLALRDELTSSGLLPTTTPTNEQLPHLEALDRTLVVALDGEGNLASQSREDLQTLLHLCGGSSSSSASTMLDRLVRELQSTVLLAGDPPPT